MLQTILLVIHILIAISLIAIILLQQGRGATAGAAFGGGASGTVFGARGSASFLTRTTSILATVFFGNCLLLAYLASQQSAPVSIGQQLEQSTTSVTTPAIDTPAATAPASAADIPPVPRETPSAPRNDLPQIPASKP